MLFFFFLNTYVWQWNIDLSGFKFYIRNVFPMEIWQGFIYMFILLFAFVIIIIEPVRTIAVIVVVIPT